jgi:hypothetical protein
MTKFTESHGHPDCYVKLSLLAKDQGLSNRVKVVVFVKYLFIYYICIIHGFVV